MRNTSGRRRSDHQRPASSGPENSAFQSLSVQFSAAPGDLVVAIEDVDNIPHKVCPGCGFRIKLTKYGEIRSHTKDGRRVDRDHPSCPGVWVVAEETLIPEFVARQRKLVSRRMASKRWPDVLPDNNTHMWLRHPEAPTPVGRLERKLDSKMGNGSRPFLYELEDIKSWIKTLREEAEAE